MRKVVAAGLVVIAVLGPLRAVAPARRRRPDASLRLSGTSVAAGLGWSWEKGVLVYRGRRHAFTVDGPAVNALGGAGSQATGNVYNLRRLEDFEGIYRRTGSDGAARGNGGVAAMRNAKGVRIELRATAHGLEALAGADGMTITREKP